MKKNVGTAGHAHSPSMKKEATKALAKEVAKVEAKELVKEVVAEVESHHKQQTPPKPNHQKKKNLATQAGVHTYVLGTGVQVPIAELTEKPTRKVSGSGRECVYTCIDRVGEVVVSSTNKVGDRLLELPLGPAFLPVTRLGVEAQNWEKFKVESWSFLFVTTQGTETSGQIIAFVDPDPRDTWEDDAYNVNKATAQFGSVPINVWQNFGTRLPTGTDTATTTYYTNPTTTSDVRFTQPGVLRVINCGGWGDLPQDGKTIYGIYQKVKLRFIDPELSLATAAARPIATITDTSFRTTVSGTPLVSSAAQVVGGVPVTVSPQGTVNIDTSNIGNNNLVVEMVVDVANNSDVETTIGIDPQGESFLDQAVSTIRAVYGADQSFVGQAQAAAHVVLSGRQSWSLDAVLLGVAVVVIRQAVMRFWLVPGNVRTLERAAKITGIKFGRKIPNKPKLSAYTPPSWYNSTTASLLFGNASNKDWPEDGTNIGVLSTMGWGVLPDTAPNWQCWGWDPKLEVDLNSQAVGWTWKVNSLEAVWFFTIHMTIGVTSTGNSTFSIDHDAPHFVNTSNCTVTQKYYLYSDASAATKSVVWGFTVVPEFLGHVTVMIRDLVLEIDQKDTAASPKYFGWAECSVLSAQGAEVVATSKSHSEFQALCGKEPEKEPAQPPERSRSSRENWVSIPSRPRA